MLRVCADATAAVLIWALVRDLRPRWAIWAWLAAAVTAAQPTSANPTAPALGLLPGRRVRRDAGETGDRGRAGRGSRRSGARTWACSAALAAAATIAWADRDGARCDETGGYRRFRHKWGGEAAAAARRRGRPRGALAASRAARCRSLLATAALAGLALYAPFIVAAGPGTVWDALVVQATRDGEYWRLPFPNGFAGGDVKDFLAWLAPYGALVVVVLAAIRRTALGLVVLGAGAAIYFVSRADLEHAQGLLVVAAGLAALVRPKLVGAALLAILIVVGAGNRAAALLRPPELKPFESVRIPPAEADALPKVIALVQRARPARASRSTSRRGARTS